MTEQTTPKLLMITRQDLNGMSDDELRRVQNSLGQFINTEFERVAARLNSYIFDEWKRRKGYGF